MASSSTAEAIRIRKKMFSAKQRTLIPYLFIAIALAFITCLIIDHRFYRSLLVEDHAVEWFTFVGLIVAALFFAMAAVRTKSTYRSWRYFFSVFAVLLFLGGMEEISWGQRVLGIQTPETWAEHNDQGELNIHNTLQELTSPIKTKHGVGLVMLLYGFVVPYFMRKGKLRLPDLITRRMPFPPPFLYTGFFVGALFMLDMPTEREEEIGEFLLAMCLALFGIHMAGIVGEGKPESTITRQ